MIFQFQLIFVPTGTLCLMLFAPTNLQTHGVAHQVRYNLFLIWDPFNKAYRTTCSRARDKEKLSKVKKKALKNEFMTIWLLFNVLKQNQWVKETNPIAIISWKFTLSKIYYL